MFNLVSTAFIPLLIFPMKVINCACWNWITCNTHNDFAIFCRISATLLTLQMMPCCKKSNSLFLENDINVIPRKKQVFVLRTHVDDYFIILEENLKRIQEISAGIQRIRKINNQHLDVDIDVSTICLFCSYCKMLNTSWRWQSFVQKTTLGKR